MCDSVLITVSHDIRILHDHHREIFECPTDEDVIGLVLIYNMKKFMAKKLLMVMSMCGASFT